jgi:GR25 family glycosyltransferase involved in LPS biosynthesis
LIAIPKQRYIDTVDYCVIHMKGNVDRNDNVQSNQRVLGKNIRIFDAIDGRKLPDVRDLTAFDDRLVNSFVGGTPAELGCYLSHFMVVKNAMYIEGVTVIFEDDFLLTNRGLHGEIMDIVNTLPLDFDLCFLGQIMRENHGTLYNQQLNIYHVDTSNGLYGTHAYILNNKCSSHICESLLVLDCAIDDKYKILYDRGTLNLFIVYPSIVNVRSTLPSIIGNRGPAQQVL